MSAKTYKARTITGAQQRVRELVSLVRQYEGALGESMMREKRLQAERRALAMLAAKGPAFFNPLEAMAAENLRDGILCEECHMQPDGTPIAPPSH